MDDQINGQINGQINKRIDGDAAGSQTRMVDVSAKSKTLRVAIARAMLRCDEATTLLISNAALPKGDAISSARIAGVMAAKRTPDLIPLCHPLALTSVDMAFEIAPGEVSIEARVTTIGPTGVEMEALTAVSVAALTVYDMSKAVDRSMSICSIVLVEKSGGRSGDWRRDDASGDGGAVGGAGGND